MIFLSLLTSTLRPSPGHPINPHRHRGAARSQHGAAHWRRLFAAGQPGSHGYVAAVAARPAPITEALKVVPPSLRGTEQHSEPLTAPGLHSAAALHAAVARRERGWAEASVWARCAAHAARARALTVMQRHSTRLRCSTPRRPPTPVIRQGSLVGDGSDAGGGVQEVGEADVEWRRQGHGQQRLSRRSALSQAREKPKPGRGQSETVKAEHSFYRFTF